MKWIRRHIVEILMIVLNTFLLTNLILSAYDVQIADRGQILADFLKIAVPAGLILAGIIGLIRDRKVINLLAVILGGLLLYQTFHLDFSLLLEGITNINEKLSLSKTLLYEDFAYLLGTVSLLLIAAAFMSTYIFPWNLMVMDIALIFFLWAVDYFLDPLHQLTPFIFLWAFLIAYGRSRADEPSLADTTANKISYGGRLTQIIVMALVAALITANLTSLRKGPVYDKVWMRANDFLMQDDFLSGTSFLDSFSLRSAGYNDSSTALGGDVTMSDTLVMTLKGDSPGYLRGNTKYAYTGMTWERNDNIYRTENLASGDMLSYYSGLPKLKYDLTPVALDTMSLFVPSYPDSVILSDRVETRVYYGINDQTFMANLPVKSPYTVYFTDEAKTAQKAAGSQNLNDLQSYGNYLEISESVTQRTIDLTLSITEGLKSPTEIARAIRGYLTSNFAYSLEPGELPPGEDFVDYFLFEGRQGYCVYFASAMTIMLRIAGVPARYAEGFKVFRETDETGAVLVRNSDAHAWAEVLTDAEAGIWTIWDATGTPRDQGNSQPPENGEPPEDTTPNQPQQTKPPSTTVPKADDTGHIGNDGGDPSSSQAVYWLLLLPVALGIMLLVKKRRISHLLADPDVSKFNRYVETLLAESGLEIQPADTLLEIAGKVSEYDLNKQLKQLAQTTNAKSFGGIAALTPAKDRAEILELIYGKLALSRNKQYAWIRKYLL